MPVAERQVVESGPLDVRRVDGQLDVVLVGAEDVATPPNEGRTLANALPDAEFALIPAAGHLPPVERPRATARRIQAFLTERVDE